MQNGRNTDGKFSDGNAGRPKGSRNKATIAIEGLLEGQAEALTQTAISKALDGDSIALRHQRLPDKFRGLSNGGFLVHRNHHGVKMKMKSGTSKDAADKLVRRIKRRIRKHHSGCCCQTNENSHQIASAA